MSNTPVLFRWLDINWTLTKCLVVAGVFLMLVGAGLFLILFKHVKGKVERLNREEVWNDFNTNFGVGIRTDYLAPTMLYRGPAVGVKAQLTANINTLRQAARRGDWLTFWLWPSILSGWSIGVWLLFMAFCRRDLVIAVLVTVVPAFILLVAWFMPWAAIYTNIDLNADVQLPVPTDDRTQPPQQ
jgi:hypothetical protein